MKLIVISELGKTSVMHDGKSVPRIGDSIDIGRMPAPKVKAVMWWPEESTISQAGFKGEDIEAIVIIE